MDGRVRKSALGVILLVVMLGWTTFGPATASTIPAGSASGPAVTASANSTYSWQVLDLINGHRSDAGLPTLSWNPDIAQVSQVWVDHLAVATQDSSFDFSSVHRSDGGANEIPTGADTYSEVIAFNFTSANVVDWWMNSAPHAAALLEAKATDIGIGIATPTTGPYVGWHLVVANLAGYPKSRGQVGSSGGVPPAAISQIESSMSANPVLGGNTRAITCAQPGNGCYQDYQGGAIIWSPTTGAHVSAGPIRTAWANTGFLTGPLGYPTTEVTCAQPGNGCYQDYQGGAIIWSPTTGAHVSLK